MDIDSPIIRWAFSFINSNRRNTANMIRKTPDIVHLPFENKPYTQMYNHLAFFLGIVMGNADKDITPWLCSRYINCRFVESTPQSKFNIILDDPWSSKENLLFKQNIILEREMFDALNIDYVNLLRSMLLQGYYPYGNLNEQYIPGKLSYQRRYYLHDYLLIGFDDEKQCFLSVGYLKNKKFQEYEIPYECMVNAIKSIESSKITLGFLEFNKEFDFDLNLRKVKTELCNYLNSTADMPFLQGRYFGLAAMKQLIGEFENDLNNKKGLDNRYSRGFMEHKFFMDLRCKYLLNNSYIVSKGITDTARQVYEMAETVQMLVLKYNITLKTDIGQRAIDKMSEILEKEQDYIPLLVKELEDKRNDA